MSGAAAVEDRLVVDGVELELFRKGEGQPLLLLHGAGGFDPSAPFLEPLVRRAEVIAPSHPGFGRSGEAEHLDSIDDLAYFYLDLLDQLDLNDVTVVGFSLGGWIAAEIAVKCTCRLSRLVLVDVVGIKVGGREDRDITDIYAIPQERVDALTYHDPNLAKRDYTVLSEEERTIIARNQETATRLVWVPYMHDPKLRGRLHRIDIPTLLLWGASDGIVTPEYGEAYRESIPGARLEVIPEAGHLPHVEQPDVFAGHVLKFLA